jgi:diguanylate cyclase (GGDEF)-like protein
MSRLYNLSELNEVSPEVAGKLVESLFRQNGSLVIGTALFTSLGVIGLFGTGSVWYLIAAAAYTTVCIGRAWCGHLFATRRDSVSTIVWARRSLIGSWLSAACWGIWSSAAILYEHEKSLVVIVVGAQSAAVMASAVRTCAVRTISESQIFIMLTPMVFACLASGDRYLELFAVLIPFHAMAGLSATRYLHAQTLQLLRGNEEKSGLVASLELARQELESVNSHLEGLVLTDALTGIANRRAFDFTAAREWRRSLRENTTLALLFIDVDHFKTYNDFYGHQAGDLCLQEVAATIGSVLRRPADLLARYGGEEFAVILPQTDLKGAAEIGQAVIRAFTNLGMPHDSPSSYGHLSVSIGAAAMTANPDTSMENLTALADSALYDAKQSGRNRVCMAETPPHFGRPQPLPSHADEPPGGEPRATEVRLRA